MKHILVKQAIAVPLAASLLPMLVALTLPEYSSASQHMSELGLLEHPIALITRAANIVTGASILLLALGLLLSAPRRFKFTIGTSCVIGASMISNGLFLMGSPLHGLYGLGLFMPLAPACFAAEFGEDRAIINISLAVATLIMMYLWLMFSGLDPEGFRGITQRIATIVMWGWYAVASYALLGNGSLSLKANRAAFAEPA